MKCAIIFITNERTHYANQQQLVDVSYNRQIDANTHTIYQISSYSLPPPPPSSPRASIRIYNRWLMLKEGIDKWRKSLKTFPRKIYTHNWDCDEGMALRTWVRGSEGSFKTKKKFSTRRIRNCGKEGNCYK